MVRLPGLHWLGTALYSYLFARHGIRGTFDVRKPLRLLGLVAGRGVSAASLTARCVALFRFPDPVLAMAGN